MTKVFVPEVPSPQRAHVLCVETCVGPIFVCTGQLKAGHKRAMCLAIAIVGWM